MPETVAYAVRMTTDHITCDHSGETCERRRSGYLYDTPQGVTDRLCADCGVTLLADVEPQEEG